MADRSLDTALATLDPEIAAALDAELGRQRRTLEMIASENFAPRAVLECQGSVLTNKYAEGYPGRRYYGGCEHVDVSEQLAIDRAKELFGAEHANVQPHAGAQANNAVYHALLAPGDKILGLELSHGGHLSHGMRLNVSGRLYEAVAYGVDRESGLVVMEELARIARAERPKLIVAGWSAYPRQLDFAAFRAIADEVGARLMVDMAHFAGLVASGLHPSPVPYADVVTTTLHKTLNGPRSGLILCREDLAKKIDSAVFPGQQGGPLEHVIAAKAVALKLAGEEEFRERQERTVAGARAIAAALTATDGIAVLTGGTDVHFVLVDLRESDLDGQQGEDRLDAIGITVNRNAVPFDPRPPMVSSGLRIGTSALATRGLGTAEFAELGAVIAAALAPNFETRRGELAERVATIAARHPLYPYLDGGPGVSRYTAVTEADRAAMLAAIGVDSVADLFAAVPDGVRMDRPIALPSGRSEQAVYAHLRQLAARNVSTEDEVSFLGAGMYDSYSPALIEMLMERSEFLTPYTPYQPEVSQGGLQVMFEYQTAISELTALPVSNASVYEAPSALAAAAYLAKLAGRGNRLVVSRGVHPHGREALRTLARGYGMEVVEVGLVDGVTPRDAWYAAIDADTAAVFLQQPNFLGAIEDVAGLAETEAVVACSCDPQTLGVLRPPGECGVDVAVGEGQTLGNRLDFGGPSFGFFAAREEHLRRMPGRIAGETTDAEGRRGFVLTLQTREQHIRRERATSNICTSQALNALAGVVYLAWLGRRGIVELGELLARRTDFARRELASIDGVELLFEGPVVREFGLRFPGADLARVEQIAAACRRAGVNPGYPLGRDYPELADGLLVALTEQRTRAEIELLAETLSGASA